MQPLNLLHSFAMGFGVGMTAGLALGFALSVLQRRD
jgi:hypothetical protein